MNTADTIESRPRSLVSTNLTSTRSPLDRLTRFLGPDSCPAPQATALLAWLAEHGRAFADCAQADVDAWCVEHTVSDRVNVRAFLQWSAKTRLTRRFALPANTRSGGAPLPEPDRTALLGQVLTGQHGLLSTRAAAAILLLYTQPVSQITRLTVDDVIRDGDQFLLRLDGPPSPCPRPSPRWCSSTSPTEAT